MPKKKAPTAKNYCLFAAIIAIIIIMAISGWLLYFEGNKNTANSYWSGECEIKNPDPDGYLLKICEYLQRHNSTIFSNKNPNDYRIKEFEERLTASGDSILVIRLDCCGTGDLAFVDKNTREVVGFSAGDE